MTIEADTLKTLQNIEKTLNNAMRTFSTAQRQDERTTGRRDKPSERKNPKKADAPPSFKAVSMALVKTEKGLQGLYTTTSALNKVMGGTIGGFRQVQQSLKALSTQAQDLTKNLEFKIDLTGSAIQTSLNGIAKSLDPAGIEKAFSELQSSIASQKIQLSGEANFDVAGLDERTETFKRVLDRQVQSANSILAPVHRASGELEKSIDNFTLYVNGLAGRLSHLAVDKSFIIASQQAHEKQTKEQAKLTKTTRDLHAAFLKLLRGFKGDAPASEPLIKTSDEPRKAASDPDGGAPAATGALDALAGSGGRLGRTFKGVKSALGPVIPQLKEFYESLKSLGPVLNDYFMLQARGISGLQSMPWADVGFAALKAGMSVQEFTAVLENSQMALTRSTSIADFNKELDRTKDQVAKLGVFGPAAVKFAADMRNSATALGVPQAQISGLVDRQVDLFAQLRKTSMITAEAFATLTRDLVSNQNVQESLLGLAPRERAARLQSMQEVAVLGLRMGLTAEQSQRLGQTFLDQRRAMTEDRFKGAGMVRLGGAVTGMGAGETEELARLAQKKNLKGEEAARYQDLAARYKQGIERLKNSENVADNVIAEQIEAQLPSYLQNITEQSGQAQLAKESGPAGINADFAKSTNKFEQAVAQFSLFAGGLAKSSLVSSLLEIVPALASLVILMKANKVLGAVGQAAANGWSGGIDLPDGKGGKTKGTKAPGKKGFFSRIGGKLGGLVGLGGIASTVQDANTLAGTGVGGLPQSNPAAATQSAQIDADNARSLGKAASEPPKGLVGRIASKAGSAIRFVGKRFAPIAMIWGGIEEAISGDLQASLTANPEEAGWGEKIANVGKAALRSFATGFTGLADGIVEFFGVDLTDLVGGTFTNMFDRLWTSLSGWQSSVMASGYDMLGKIPGLGSWAKEKAEAARADAKVADDSMKKLKEDGKTNLSEIGKKNQEIQKANQEAKTKATSAVKDSLQANVVTVDALRNSVQQTQQSVAATKASLSPQAIATPAAQSTTSIATPQPASRVQVTEQAVNSPKPAETAAPGAQQVTTEGALMQNGSIEALLQQQLAAMQALLEIVQSRPGLDSEEIRRAMKGPINGSSRIAFQTIQPPL